MPMGVSGLLSFGQPVRHHAVVVDCDRQPMLRISPAHADWPPAPWPVAERDRGLPPMAPMPGLDRRSAKPLLQGPGLLQQGFLGMDQHPPSLPAWAAMHWDRSGHTPHTAPSNCARPAVLPRRHDGVGNSRAPGQGNRWADGVYETYEPGPRREAARRPVHRHWPAWRRSRACSAPAHS